MIEVWHLCVSTRMCVWVCVCTFNLQFGQKLPVDDDAATTFRDRSLMTGLWLCDRNCVFICVWMCETICMSISSFIHILCICACVWLSVYHLMIWWYGWVRWLSGATIVWNILLSVAIFNRSNRSLALRLIKREVMYIDVKFNLLTCTSCKCFKL